MASKRENIKKTIKRELREKVSDEFIGEINDCLAEAGYGGMAWLRKETKLSDTLIYSVLKDKKATRSVQKNILKALNKLKTQAA